MLIAFLLFLNYFTESVPIRFLTTSSPKIGFSVLCYNVKCSDSNYNENQINIADEIIGKSPDLVFLCEFNKSVSRCLDSLVINKGQYYSFYRSGMNSIFYSKHEIVQTCPINTGTSNGKYTLNNQIRLNIAGDTITFVGCHLSSSRKDFWEGRKKRKQEVDSIYKVIQCDPYPVIVMGDLNDFSGSYTINKLKEAGLKDSWWEGGYGYGTTFHAGLLRLRLDHILFDYKGLDLVEANVINNDLSDHNALMAKFNIK